MGTRRGVAVCWVAVAASLFVSRRALADCCQPMFRAPKNEFAVGPSIAYGHLDASRLMLGVDFTYFTQLQGFPPYLWASGGLRWALTNGPAVWLPYVEAGTWLFLNAGLGYSTAIVGDGVTHHAHVFLGLPLLPNPIIEPYYRPAFRLAGDPGPTIHEVGLLLKYSTYGL
jgi:hypothetical protein